MARFRMTGLLVVLTCTGALAAEQAPGAVPSLVQFTLHRIGTYRSESVCVADFNQDGRLDVAAGSFLYLAPEWRAVKIRTLSGEVDDQGKGYVDDFMNLPIDVDGDGKPDIVSCGWFCKCVRWHQNTLGKDGDWPEQVSDINGNFEHGDLVDIDGDGKTNEVLAHTKTTVWYEPGKLDTDAPGLIKHVISTKEMNYGGGVGDVNGDGRPDVLRPDGWFEAPSDARTGTWIEHPGSFGAKDGKSEHTPQMHTLDVNEDGLSDIVTSSAHEYGIFWYQQVREDGKEIAWKQHPIDDTWSQAHSLALADIDGDGTPDLVTGKRFMAHNGNDPDEYGKLGVYWYQLKRGKTPTWNKHVVSYDQGIGSGVNLCAIDLDKDGDIDIVVTGKWGGPVWFENLQSSP